MAAARAVQFAKWEAEKAGWKLANRGDTRYAAEKRLFNKQLTELRRNLLVEDLSARRAAYVAARERAQARQADPEAAARWAAARQLQRTETLERVQRHADEAKAEYAKNRLRAAAKLAKTDEARTQLKRAWLKNYLDTNDVHGSTEKILLASLESSKFPGERGLVSWLNKGNLVRRVEDVTWRNNSSPIDHWNGMAREIVDDENNERLGERLGGERLSGAPSSVPYASARLDNGAKAGTSTWGSGVADPAGEGDLLTFVFQKKLDDVADAIKAMEGRDPDGEKKDEP